MTIPPAIPEPTGCVEEATRRVLDQNLCSVAPNAQFFEAELADGRDLTLTLTLTNHLHSRNFTKSLRQPQSGTYFI